MKKIISSFIVFFVSLSAIAKLTTGYVCIDYVQHPLTTNPTHTQVCYSVTFSVSSAGVPIVHGYSQIHCSIANSNCYEKQVWVYGVSSINTKQVLQEAISKGKYTIVPSPLIALKQLKARPLTGYCCLNYKSVNNGGQTRICYKVQFNISGAGVPVIHGYSTVDCAGVPANVCTEVSVMIANPENQIKYAIQGGRVYLPVD